MKLGDLDDLRAFVAIVDRGGLTAAAQALDRPKSTVSRRLANLESQIGVRLLDRNARRVRLTEAGATVYRHALRVLEELALLDEALRPSEAHGVLRVATTFALAHEALAPILGGFLAAYPLVSVELEAVSRINDLVRDDFDVAVRAGELSGGALIARRLAHVELGLYASPAFLARHGPIASAKDLRGMDRLGLLGGALQRSASSTLKKPTAPSRPRLAINDPLLLRRMVTAGLGVAWLPTYLARAEVITSRLVRCLPQTKLTGPEIFALYPSRNELALKVRVFVDYLAEHLSLAEAEVAGNGT